MKKIMCFMLAFCLTVFCFSFVNFKNTYALNDDGLIINNSLTGVDTSTTQGTPIIGDFYATLKDSSNSFYLNDDIRISSVEQIDFSGTLDGKGHTITLSLSEPTELGETTEYGLFNKISSATIKNLKVNWEISSNSLNTTGILANYSEGSKIENVVVSGSINIESKQSIYAGGLIGSALGTEIKNCYSNVSIKVTGKGLTATEIVVGGLVGKMQNGIINNSFVYNSSNENLIEVTVTKDDDGTELQPIYNVYVGGLVGLILKGKIINNFTYLKMTASTINIDIQPKIGLLIGKISSGVYLPDYKSISYNYAFGNEGDLVGELSSYNLTNCSLLSDVSILKETTTFKNSTMWDSIYPWDFDTTWCVKADNHIVLQVFEKFSISVSAPDYVEFTITASATSSSTNTFDFGESVTISAKIEEGKSLYYKISNIKKDEINLKNESEDNDEYSTTIQISSITSGLYTINTSTINYGFTVESGDFSQGGVKIKGAQVSRETIDEISLSIDGDYAFEAVPAKNYGFVEWVWVTNEDDGTEILTPAKLGKQPEPNEADARQLARQSITIRFTEDQTVNNNYLYVPLPENSEQTYKLRAIFTSQVCDMTMRTSLSTENCATIYVNEIPYEYSSDNNYLFLGTISRDADVVIRIEVKEGYEFKGWQAGNTSDPIETFLKDCSATDEEIIFRTTNNNFLLIANIEKAENSGSNLNWLWWTLGGIGGAGIIGVAIWLIIRRARNADFMSGY